MILGPVLAMFLSHVFSASRAQKAELHQRPGRSEQMGIIRTESRFLLLAAPALSLLAVLTVAGISLSQAIQAVILLEGASLGFWGFVAGHWAGLTGWSLARTVLFGLIVGLLVLALQVFLQPGNASFSASDCLWTSDCPERLTAFQPENRPYGMKFADLAAWYVRASDREADRTETPDAHRRVRSWSDFPGGDRPHC